MKVCHGAPNLVKIGQKKKFGYFPCKPKYFPTAARDTNSQNLDDRMSPTYMQLTCTQTVPLRLCGKSRNVNKPNDVSSLRVLFLIIHFHCQNTLCFTP